MALGSDEVTSHSHKFFQSFKSNSSSALCILEYLWLAWVKSTVIMVLGSDEDLTIAVCSLPFEQNHRN